jgi:hypothetical protein
MHDRHAQAQLACQNVTDGQNSNQNQFVISFSVVIFRKAGHLSP